MKQSGVKRLIALCTLLLHGSALGAACVYDALAASRANASVIHIEADAGKDCYSHDEATCQLCRVATAAGCAAPPHVAPINSTRGALPIAAYQELPRSAARSGLHSRAPPAA